MTPDHQFELPPRRDPREPRTRRDAMPWLAALTLTLTAAALAGGWLYWQHVRSQKLALARQELATIEAKIAEHRAKQLAAPARTAANMSLADARQPTAEQVVDDPQRKLLWASPTNGPPISLAYVPTGTLCLVHLRPAQLAAHPEGEKVLAALGPWGAHAGEQFEALAGAKLEEIDEALASLVVARDGSIAASLRVEPVAPWDETELAKRFPSAREQTRGEQSYLVDDERAWFLAPAVGATGKRVLVACPVAIVEELIDSQGDAPMLARDLEGLVAASDAARTATTFIGAKFLAASGTHLMEGEAEPLRDAIAALLGNDATAASLSLHWGNAFFVELRATPALTVPPRWLATTLQTRMAEAADDMAATTNAGTWSEYGRNVVARVPAMVKKLAAMSRRGEADKHAVVRAYLPTVAGHNLLMGAELLLTQAAPNDTRHAHADEGMAHRPDAGGATIEQKLAKVTSLTFPKETLQRALELLADDVGVAIEIDGSALRAEGITQNQSFALAERDKAAADILVAILRRANPDPTATNAADPRQKLVYVIDPTAGAPGRMIVTTRAAAAESGRALPAVFGGDGG